MSGSINEVLRGIVDRHGRILLDDHRRCESCLRDSALTPKEISGLLGALKVGIPKRIAAVPSIGEKGVANFAAELSETSGLSEQVAQTSVQAWAFALGADSSAKKQIDSDEDRVDHDPKPAGASLLDAIFGVIGLALISGFFWLYPAYRLELTWTGILFGAVILVKSTRSILNYIESRRRRGQ